MALPPDIYPESHNRLPLVRRDEFDEFGQKIFDETAGDSRSLVGLQGPGGIRLHSPALTANTRPASQWLRFGAGLDKRLAELTILVAAREMNAHFEWHAHEPAALKAGLEPTVIDVVRHRKPLAGLGEREAALIAVGREAIGKHRVSAATFADALRVFGKEQLLHYVSLMGSYAATAILLAVFDQHLPDGATSALPE
jgi:4-carboxymuconolactone decarboxylase